MPKASLSRALSRRDRARPPDVISVRVAGDWHRRAAANYCFSVPERPRRSCEITEEAIVLDRIRSAGPPQTDCAPASPPRLRQAGFFRSFDLGGDRAKGGERGFVVPIGSFTFRRSRAAYRRVPSGPRPPALQLPSTSDTRADLQSASALRQNEFVTGLFHGGGERGPTRLFSCVLVAGTLHRSIVRTRCRHGGHWPLVPTRAFPSVCAVG
jgi:hypothetical protein